MNLLLFALIVLVVIAIACWIIHLVPLPSEAPAGLKQILMAVVAAVGLIVILVAVLGGVTTPVLVTR